MAQSYKVYDYDGKCVFDSDKINQIDQITELKKKLDTVKKNVEKVVHKEDVVNHPSHYTSGKIEVIDFITDQKLDFALGNVVKYVSRAGKKHEKGMNDLDKMIQDLEKAQFYLKHKIAVLKKVKKDANET